MPEIKFNKKIYAKAAIQEAVRAYSHLARLKVKNNKDYTVIGIEGIDPGLKRIFSDEFSNYVLGMSKKWI